MSRRHVNKKRARVADCIRWELVHAAGCMSRGLVKCAGVICVEDGLIPFTWSDAPELEPRRVSVPRSLRPMLGRWVGGE